MLCGLFFILQVPIIFASATGNSTDDSVVNTTYATPVQSVRVMVNPEQSMNHVRRSWKQNDHPQIFVPPYFSNALLDDRLRHGMSKKRTKIGTPTAADDHQQLDAQTNGNVLQNPLGVSLGQQATQFQFDPNERDMSYAQFGYPTESALGNPPMYNPDAFSHVSDHGHPFNWGVHYSNATVSQNSASSSNTERSKVGRPPETGWQRHKGWVAGSSQSGMLRDQRKGSTQAYPNGQLPAYWQSQGAPPSLNQQMGYQSAAQLDPFLLNHFLKSTAGQANRLGFPQNLQFPEVAKNPSDNEPYGRATAEMIASTVGPPVGMFFERSTAANIPVSGSPFNAFQPKTATKPKPTNKYPSERGPPFGYPMFASYQMPDMQTPSPTTTSRPASTSLPFVLRAHVPPANMQYKSPFDAPAMQQPFEQNFLGPLGPPVGSPNVRVTYSLNPNQMVNVPDESMGKDKDTIISSHPQPQGGLGFTGFGNFENISQMQLEQSPINYCSTAEFDDQILASVNLKRMDYFVVNMSCSNTFYQCAAHSTFVRRCPGPDHVFDHLTLNCNYRYNVKTCMEYDHVLHCTVKTQCLAEEYACCAVPQQCISYARRCDGVLDCADGEDENNCPSCSMSEFPCLIGGICIPMERRCNGMPDDCFDGTNADEKYCDVCGSGRFFCYKSEAQYELGCIDASQRCDGVKDCQGGEDELNCKKQGAQFLLCENQRQSVPRKQWCDGNEDCADGSDEAYCEY
uniref:Chitin-binding type-2 domain-containing protein n=1 Tax=Trichuris muris TaxID=70415 RepID=A0A5S6R099_TRIMR